MSDSQTRIEPIFQLSDDGLRQIAVEGIVHNRTVQLTTERETLMNANQIQKRLHWLEQAIADGRNEPWMYYHAAEMAAAVGKTEKANRYLRIAMMRGWSHNEKII